MEQYTDGMRQTVVADLHRLNVTDPVLLATAKEGDLDATLVRLTELQPPEANDVTSESDLANDVTARDAPDFRLASNTAYMIPLITAWQKQLGRQPEA